MALRLLPLTPFSSSSSSSASALHRISTPFPSSFSSTTTTFPSSLSSATRSKRRGLLHGKSSSLIALRSSSAAAAAVEKSVQSSEGSRKRLIAQNIPWTCTAEDIRSLFEKHGTVTDVELSMHNSSRNRGLAFITMSSEEEALAALNSINLYEFNGRAVKVEFARSMKRSPPNLPVAPTAKYNVFVGNLTWRVRSSDLRDLFNGSGYLSAEVIYQSNPRRSAGYGFVSFTSREEAEAAINKLNGQKLLGRNVRLVLGKAQADNVEEKPQTD